MESLKNSTKLDIQSGIVAIFTFSLGISLGLMISSAIELTEYQTHAFATFFLGIAVIVLLIGGVFYKRAQG